MIARIDKAGGAALNHFQLAQLGAQQSLFGAERIFERVDSSVKPFLDMAVVGEAASELLCVVRVRIDKSRKNHLSRGIYHPSRSLIGENRIGLAHGNDFARVDGHGAVAKNPSITIDGN
jgi:hypothetical protein